MTIWKLLKVLEIQRDLEKSRKFDIQYQISSQETDLIGLKSVSFIRQMALFKIKQYVK